MELKFGELNYKDGSSIELKETLDLKDVKVSVFHGSNGVGKSTLVQNIELKLKELDNRNEVGIYNLENLVNNKFQLIDIAKNKIILQPHFQEIKELKDAIAEINQKLKLLIKNDPNS